MKSNDFTRRCPRLPRIALGAVLLAAVSIARAQTLWTGPDVTFTQFDPNASDTIVQGVVISRGQNGPLTGTSDTMWAFGTLSQYSTLGYQTFDTIRANANGDLASVLLSGGPMVVHLVNENIYLSLTFTAWGQHFAGGFSYTRSTAPAAPPTPSVSLTNPVASAVFAAPANIKLAASASVSSGTITNVTFYNGNARLGSAATAPFALTASNLAANTYSLTAVAIAAGVSATSQVVSIRVVTPAPLSNSVPAIAGGHFTFDYAATPGLTYVIKSSPDYLTWSPVATNVATANPAVFTDNSALRSTNLFYEVVLEPNP